MNINLDDYDKVKCDESGVITLSPKKPPIPRLAKAPKYTPIQVRDREDSRWHPGYSFVKYKSERDYKWKTGGSNWKHARLIPGYRYTWDTSWELFVEDDLEVKTWLTSGDTASGFVDSFYWGPGGGGIVAFEIVE